VHHSFSPSGLGRDVNLDERHPTSTSDLQAGPSTIPGRLLPSHSPPPYSDLGEGEGPSTSLSPRGPAPPEMFVDASAHGIGLVFDKMWLAWTFNPRHKLIPCGPDRKPIMSWAELIAVELGVRTLLAANYRNVSVSIRSDNEGVVQAFKWRKWIPKFGLHAILQRILRLCERGGIQLKVKWVWTKVNPADGPSRGLYPPSTMKLAHSPDIPQDLVGMIHEVVE